MLHNLNLPAEFNEKELSEISSEKYYDFAKKLDKYELLSHYDLRAISSLLGVMRVITNSTDLPIHMLQHESMTGYRFDKDFLDGDMFALQDDLKYTALQTKHPVKLSSKAFREENMEIFSSKLQKRGLTFDQLIKEIDEKTLYIYSRDVSEVVPKAKEYLNGVISDGFLPVHFSTYLLNNSGHFFEQLLSLQGLHIHLYSNNRMDADFKENCSYNIVSDTLKSPWGEKQKVMLESQIKLLPESDLKFLKDPRDELNTFLAYHVK